MPGIETTITEIESKVRKLMEVNLTLRTKVESLEVAVSELQNTINQNNTIINNLTEENKQLIQKRTTPKKECDLADLATRINTTINTIDQTLLILEQTEK